MNQENLPRYHQAPKNISMSQNETKYKNMRLMLLSTLILSALNCITVFALDMFYYFSAYLPFVLVAVGKVFLEEVANGEIVFVVYTALAVIMLIPYLLCYIFSKKHVGWMIAGLVIFSVDTGFLLVDLITGFNVTLAICMVFHVYIIVTLALGIKYGLKVKQERENATVDATADAYGPEGAYMPQADGSYAPAEESPYANVRRTVTVIRKKAFVGAAVALYCYAGSTQVCTLKNGKSADFEATGDTFILRAGTSNGLVTGEIQIPAGTENLTYEVSMKMGALANTLAFRQII